MWYIEMCTARYWCLAEYVGRQLFSINSGSMAVFQHGRAVSAKTNGLVLINIKRYFTPRNRLYYHPAHATCAVKLHAKAFNASIFNKAGVGNPDRMHLMQSNLLHTYAYPMANELVSIFFEANLKMFWSLGYTQVHSSMCKWRWSWKHLRWQTFQTTNANLMTIKLLVWTISLI